MGGCNHHGAGEAWVLVSIQHALCAFCWGVHAHSSKPSMEGYRIKPARDLLCAGSELPGRRLIGAHATCQLLLMLLQLRMYAAVPVTALLLTGNAEVAQILQIMLFLLLRLCNSCPQCSIFCCERLQLHISMSELVKDTMHVAVAQ